MRLPVYMLAADHRWQWDEWCDANGVGRDRIQDAKALALEGLLAAQQQHPAIREHVALLVDEQYGAATLARARGSGLIVGTPAEKPGVFPLEWTADPFWRAVPGDFAKVLVRYRPEWPAEDRDAQMDKLLRLAEWCRAEGKPLLLEIIIQRADEPAEEFERIGRPRLLARVIAECYGAGIVPDFWKLEGTTDREAIKLMDDAIAARPSPRLLILGKGAGFDLIDGWFSAAAAAERAAGFAIGRSVYWQPASDFLSGRSTRDTAIEAIARNYLRVIRAWDAAAAPAARADQGPARPA